MGEKTKRYEDVIAYPATKSTDAVTIASAEYFDFEPSGLASFAIENTALIANQITDTITVTPYVSFDEGTTWLIARATGYADMSDTGGDVVAVSETVDFVISATGGDQVAEYDGRYFVLYDGTTPTVIWFDVTGTDTIPTSIGFDGAAAIKIDISGAGDTADGIGAVIDTDLASGGFTAVYTSGTNTLVATTTAAGVCTNASAGNMLTATAVVDSFGVSQQGVDAVTGFAFYNHVLDIAPRVRVDAIFDGSAELAVGHGCQTDIVMTEVDYGKRKKVFNNVMTIPTTAPIGFTFYSDTMTIDDIALNQMLKVWLFAYCADLSKTEEQVYYILQASDDNVNWWNCSAAVTDIDSTTGILHSVTSIVHGTTYYLGKYLRLHFYDNDNTGTITTGHGIQFNVIVEY